MNSTWSKLFGKYDPGEAIEKTFSRARFGLIEEGGAKIGVFGGALEALGPAGLAAAAGLTAVGLALELGKKAAEYAEDIQNTATKLGITTKALQEFNYAAIASGVSTDDLKVALQSGNEVLGAFQSNIGAAQIKPVFAALGITQAEAQKAGTIIDLLPEIADKIQHLGSTAEQSKVAEKLGLAGILPILQKGREGIEELTKEAQNAGVVLDASMIRKGKEAAEALKEAADVVDINMKRAFINLAPILAECLRVVAAIAKQIADISEDAQGIGSFSSAHVKSAQGQVDGALATTASAARVFGSTIDPATGRLTGGGATGALGLNAYYNALLGQKSKLAAQGKFQDLSAGIGDLLQAKPAAAKALVTDKVKTGPADQTGDFDKSARDAVDSASKEYASALADLTKDVEAHAAFEKQAVDEDTAKKLTDLSAEELKIRQSKNDAHKAEQVALLEKAKTETQNAADAKKESIDRKAEQALADQNLAKQEAIDKYYDQILQITASLARSSSERLALDLKILAQQKAEADRSRDAQRKSEIRASPADASGINSKYEALQNAANDAYAAQVTQTQHQNLSPWDAWKDSGLQSVGEVSDALQSEAVKSVDAFNDGLTDAIVNGKSMGEVFHSIFATMESDLIKYLLKQEEIAAFGGQTGGFNLLALFGAGGTGGSSITSIGASAATSQYASGTDYTAGGLSLVGEKGPELLNLPRGGQVIPNNLLDRLSRMSPQSVGGGAATVNHTIKIDLTGANGDDTIRAIATQAAQAGTLQAIAYSNGQMKKAQRASGRDITRF